MQSSAGSRYSACRMAHIGFIEELLLFGYSVLFSLTRHWGTVSGQETPPIEPTFLSESSLGMREIDPAPARGAEDPLHPNPPEKNANHKRGENR